MNPPRKQAFPNGWYFSESNCGAKWASGFLFFPQIPDTVNEVTLKIPYGNAHEKITFTFTFQRIVDKKAKPDW